jgi:hypothetical protein
MIISTSKRLRHHLPGDGALFADVTHRVCSLIIADLVIPRAILDHMQSNPLTQAIIHKAAPHGAQGAAPPVPAPACPVIVLLRPHSCVCVGADTAAAVDTAGLLALTLLDWWCTQQLLPAGVAWQHDLMSQDLDWLAQLDHIQLSLLTSAYLGGEWAGVLCCGLCRGQGSGWHGASRL